jgi:hemerythrin superfamily protein
LPKWDAPADPAIVSIEAFPKTVSLETSADFHRVIVIARMKDASTHDITHQSKISPETDDIAALNENLLTPKKDGETKAKSRSPLALRFAPPRWS